MPVRPLTEADLPTFAALVARAGVDVASRDLHTEGTPPEALVAEIRALETWVGAMEDGGTAAFLVDVFRERGWGWGPTVEGDDREARASAVLEHVLARLPPGVTRLSFFPHTEAWMARWLEARGADRGPIVHVYRASNVAAGPQSPRVRAPRADDAVALEALHERSFPHTYLDTASMLDSPIRAVFVADAGSGVAGYVCVEVQEDGGGYVHYLAVEPGARRQGLGTELLGAGLGWLAARGVPEVHLTVSDDNGARLLYERAGLRLAATGQTLDLWLGAGR